MSYWRLLPASRGTRGGACPDRPKSRSRARLPTGAPRRVAKRAAFKDEKKVLIRVSSRSLTEGASVGRCCRVVHWDEADGSSSWSVSSSGVICSGGWPVEGSAAKVPMFLTV